MRWWLPPLLSCQVVACSSNDGIDFPETLGLLETNRAPAIDDDGLPEVIVFASGNDDGRHWAHARAYVHGTPDEVYDALHEPKVLVDRREIDEWTVTWDTVPRFDMSLTLHQTVHDVIKVEYDTTWAVERQQLDAIGLERFAAQWDKTDGTAFIDLLAGSMVATRASADVTELQMVTWLEATLRDDETLKSYLRDLHGDIVAKVAGESLPSY